MKNLRIKNRGTGQNTHTQTHKHKHEQQIHTHTTSEYKNNHKKDTQNKQTNREYTHTKSNKHEHIFIKTKPHNNAIPAVQKQATYEQCESSEIQIHTNSQTLKNTTDCQKMAKGQHMKDAGDANTQSKTYSMETQTKTNTDFCTQPQTRIQYKTHMLKHTNTYTHPQTKTQATCHNSRANKEAHTHTTTKNTNIHI